MESQEDGLSEGERKGQLQAINQSKPKLSKANLGEDREAMSRRVPREDALVDIHEVTLGRGLMVIGHQLGNIGHFRGQIRGFGGLKDLEEGIQGDLGAEFIRPTILVEDEIIEGIGGHPDLGDALHVDEATALPIGAGADSVEGLANLGFVPRVLVGAAELVGAVGELAFPAIVASPGLLEGAAELGFVEV